MEKEKHDPCSSKEKKLRNRKECVVPDEYRCQRSDQKKNWRCKNARVNHKYCQHHIDLTTKNYMARKERQKQDPLSSCEKERKVDKQDIATEDPINFCKEMPKKNKEDIVTQGPINFCKEMPKKDKRDIATEDQTACIRQNDSSQTVGITKRALSISDLKELPPDIMMEVWNRDLTPGEKHSLVPLLPECHRDDAVVMSIFCGKTSRFGIDCAVKWCKSVCKGKENPDAVQQKERQMKILQSQYLKDLKEYHDGFISKAEEFKWLCFDICKEDDRMFRKRLQEYEHDLTVLKL